MFILIGSNMFKRFKHDSSEGSLGLNRKCLNIGAFRQFNKTPPPAPLEPGVEFRVGGLGFRAKGLG